MSGGQAPPPLLLEELATTNAPPEPPEVEDADVACDALFDVLEALESIEPIGGATTAHAAGRHPKYGDLVRLTGLTSAGRAITLVAPVDRLPLVLVDIEAEG